MRPPRETLLALLRSPNIASRRPLFEQYDAIVQSRTVRRPAQADAAVLMLHPGPRGGEMAGGEGREEGMGSGWAGPQSKAAPDGSRTETPALAVSIDCNGRRVAADPYRGTIEAALECAANLACVGASPLGTTNNLNFGNPEKPHIAWQLAESVRGLGDACRALAGADRRGQRLALQRGSRRPDLPDAGGGDGRSPARRRARGTDSGLPREGDAIALVGPFTPSLPASELAKLHGQPLPDGLAEIDLKASAGSASRRPRGGAGREL